MTAAAPRARRAPATGRAPRAPRKSAPSAAAPAAPAKPAAKAAPAPAPKPVKLAPVSAKGAAADVRAGASSAGLGSVESTIKIIAGGVGFLIFVSVILALNTPTFLTSKVSNVISEGFKALKGEY